MAVNQKMFAEIHELITEFPELHDQTSWETDPAVTERCGTTRCIAGWATWIGARDNGLLAKKRQMTGLQVRWKLVDLLGLSQSDLDEEEYYHSYGTIDHPVLGGKLLGLSGEVAYSLFHDFNAERVVARVKAFAETGEDISEEEYDSYNLVG